MSGNLQIVAGEENSGKVTSERNHSRIFLALLAAGLVTFFIGTALLTVAASLLSHSSSINFGVIILLGPFPIVIGAGPEPLWTLFAAALFGVLTITALLLAYKRRKRADR